MSLLLLRCLRMYKIKTFEPITIKLISARLHTKHNELKQQQQQQGQSNSKFLQEAINADLTTDVRPLGEKIKETTKTASYTAIIIAGLGVTGVMLFTIFKELFASDSSNNIYSDALKRVREDKRVQDALGAPIKGFGETTRRGRRNHVAHVEFERDGVPHMRMQFYIQGIRNKGTVYLETRHPKNNGKLEFRYFFVHLDHYPRSTIILEDNRHRDPAPETAISATPNTAMDKLQLTSHFK